MVLWFIVAAAVAIGIIFYSVKEAEIDLLGPIMLTWFLCVLMPSMFHTHRTAVKEAKLSEYRLYTTSPYSVLLLSDIRDNTPDAKKIGNAYLLHKIQQGEYRVVKHTRYNMWGFKSVAGVEYFVLAD